MPRKIRNSQLDLPALELHCMRALWRLSEATVDELRASLLKERPLAYTTVQTIMDRLARKGLTARKFRGRAHVYRPLVPEHLVRDHAIDRLTRSFFFGSRDRLRDYLSTARTENAGSPRRSASRKRGVAATTRVGNIDPSLL